MRASAVVSSTDRAGVAIGFGYRQVRESKEILHGGSKATRSQELADPQYLAAASTVLGSGPEVPNQLIAEFCELWS